MKRNLFTFGVAFAMIAAMFTANAYFSPSRKLEAQQEEAKKAAEKIKEAKAEEEKAKKEAVKAAADKTPPPAPAPAPAAAPAAPAAPSTPVDWPASPPDTFKVKFETTAGDWVVEVHKDWAPIGAERFFTLCKEGFFDNTAFFRVVPGFVAQFGLAADPAVSQQWESKPLKDDAVKQTNAPGTLVFAATSQPNSRTTQLFVNYGNNGRLDGMGFAPFGKIIEGFENAQKINQEYGERPQQGLITTQGDAYISKFFPNITKIKKTTLVK